MEPRQSDIVWPKIGTVLYCTVLYCTVLCCTVLYCTVLHCTVLYCTVLYCPPITVEHISVTFLIRYCTVALLSWSPISKKYFNRKEVRYCKCIIVEPRHSKMFWPKRGVVLCLCFRRATPLRNGLADNRYCTVALLSRSPVSQK